MTFIVLQVIQLFISYSLCLYLLGCAYLGQDLGHRHARVDWLLTVYNQQIDTPTCTASCTRDAPIV